MPCCCPAQEAVSDSTLTFLVYALYERATNAFNPKSSGAGDVGTQSSIVGGSARAASRTVSPTLGANTGSKKRPAASTSFTLSGGPGASNGHAPKKQKSAPAAKARCPIPRSHHTPCRCRPAVTEPLKVCLASCSSKASAPAGRQSGRAGRGSKPMARDLSDECIYVVNYLMKKDGAVEFNSPVDRELYPEYYQAIKKPMDLGSVLANLKVPCPPRPLLYLFAALPPLPPPPPAETALRAHQAGKYTNPQFVLDDVLLVFANCRYTGHPDPLGFRVLGF